MRAICARTGKDCVDKYSFPSLPHTEFKLAGVPAHHVQGYPKEWGEKRQSLTSERRLRNLHKNYLNYHSAVSVDGKLLGVAANKRILIYEIETKELRQTLEGAGTVAFRPKIPI